jgi:hypothetical protein
MANRIVLTVVITKEVASLADAVAKYEALKLKLANVSALTVNAQITSQYVTEVLN